MQWKMIMEGDYYNLQASTLQHNVCHVINFEPFVLALRCLYQNAQQRQLLTDR